MQRAKRIGRPMQAYVHLHAHDDYVYADLLVYAYTIYTYLVITISGNTVPGVVNCIAFGNNVQCV